MGSEFQFSYEADVVVCGAGTAGSVAAVAAANEGKKVAVIEQFGAAGGSATLALVTPLMRTGIKGNPMCSYISQEINAKLVEYGGASGDGTEFDPQMLSLVLEELLAHDNIKIFYHTFICDVLKSGDSIEGIIVHNKSGRGMISGKACIDATGDGDVSFLAKASFQSGDEETKKNQPVSLRYMLGGIDIGRFWNYMNSYKKPEQREAYDPERNFHAAVTVPDRGWPLYPVFMEAIAKGDLTEDDAVYWQAFGVPGRKDTLAFNCPEFFDRTNGVDNEDLTFVQTQGKKAILRQLRFYKKYFPGFENSYISSIASMVGIRESRRIDTDYVLTAEDVLAHRKFDDGIAQSNYPVDIHGRKLKLVENKSGKPDIDNDKPYYEIPYRSLLVKGIDNLLVAGRCIGADFVAQSSLRVMPTCRAIGEACGIAASMSIDKNMSPHRIDGAHVRRYMIQKGAKFD